MCNLHGENAHVAQSCWWPLTPPQDRRPRIWDRSSGPDLELVKASLQPQLRLGSVSGRHQLSTVQRSAHHPPYSYGSLGLT